MKFRYIKSILSAASLLLAVSVTSCIGDLDATPIDPNIVMTFDQASVFNKIYGTLGLTGQKGPDGSGDLDDIDEGTSSFLSIHGTMPVSLLLPIAVGVLPMKL